MPMLTSSARVTRRFIANIPKAAQPPRQPLDTISKVHPNFLVWSQNLSRFEKNKLTKVLNQHWQTFQKDQHTELGKFLPKRMSTEGAASNLLAFNEAERHALLNLLRSETVVNF